MAVARYLYDRNGSLVSVKEGDKTTSCQYDWTHAVEYRDGVDPREISTWPGETRAYEAERLFQIESGMPVTFEDIDEMMVHIWSNYSRG